MEKATILLKTKGEFLKATMFMKTKIVTKNQADYLESAGTLSALYRPGLSWS